MRRLKIKFIFFIFSTQLWAIEPQMSNEFGLEDVEKLNNELQFLKDHYLKNQTAEQLPSNEQIADEEIVNLKPIFDKIDLKAAAIKKKKRQATMEVTEEKDSQEDFQEDTFEQQKIPDLKQKRRIETEFKADASGKIQRKNSSTESP